MSKKVSETKAPKTVNATKTEAKESNLAFTRQNYILMILGIVLIALGFILMIGGGSDDPNVFNPEIFSFRRITLAPILVLLGFAVELYAIMKKPKENE